MSDQTKSVASASTRSMPVAGIVAGTLLVLDLLGKIHVSWWVVAAVWLSPLILFVGILALLAAVAGTLLLAAWVSEIPARRRRRQRLAQVRAGRAVRR